MNLSLTVHCETRQIGGGCIGITHPIMPAHPDVRPSDVVAKRLHDSIAAAAKAGAADFSDPVLVLGAGTRTVQRLRHGRRPLKIATFNINNVNKRLANLLAWLDEAKPDVVCLQELKAVQAAFPEAALRDAGYSAVWRGQKSWNGVAILARGHEPVLTAVELPGDPEDLQSRYIEAAVDGVIIASIYLPNGNPRPGPKFEYKLAWFERLIRHAADLLAANVPVVLAGDYNVVPTDLDIYPTTSYRDNALLQPGSRAAFQRLIDQGWTDAIRAVHPDCRVYTVNRPSILTPDRRRTLGLTQSR